MVSFLPPDTRTQTQQQQKQRAPPTPISLLPNPPPPPQGSEQQLHRSIHSSLLRPAARLLPTPLRHQTLAYLPCPPRPRRAPSSPPDFRTSDRPHSDFFPPARRGEHRATALPDLLLLSPFRPSADDK